MTATKALVGDANGDWELRSASKNEDGTYTVGRKADYVPKPETHIRTLRLKTFFGYKRYKFFVAFQENPVPLDLQSRGNVSEIDTSELLNSFRRAHIVEGLGRAARQLPGGNRESMYKLLLYAGIGIVALILYYSGALNGLLDWATGAP